ncbi:lysophospholipase L1-like esterase [Kribbella voronezhensis]|uniref:Lysophospholipase L1-like esterase n=1 Tax=Kribbella voronezhensis TaxID=2512212 RepID=A0A4R7SX72_9ACTN|nr:SGNH/GDSL hydrolase family protein [Kribbella voronezhensis]TDU83585.1 lysophospholipase L1-like esterase [Kribbella voronezhensis]
MTRQRMAVVTVAMMLCAGGLLATLGAGGTADRETTSLPATPSPGGKPLRVVALGDSVTAGAACGCTAFPEIYGRLLSQRTGVQVTVENRGVSGLDSEGLLRQLEAPAAAKAVGSADVDLITIGANDFGDHHDEVVAASCSQDCVSDELNELSGTLHHILQRIRQLRAARPTTALVTGYWNVFEDGQVARQTFSTDGIAATVELTRRVNTVIETTALAEGATPVDLAGPFQREGADVTGLLAADGDHPNGSGHQLIAEVLLAAGLPRMRP